MFKKLICAVAGIAVALLASATTPAPAAADGVYTDRTFQRFTDRNGVSSEYHIYAAGLAGARAHGLLLQFHGNGAAEFSTPSSPSSPYSLGGPDGIVAEARERGFITVPVRTPDRSGTITWYEDGLKNAAYVRDLLLHLMARYPIDTERIWLVGYSGGAQFVTQFLLPQYSALIQGGGAVVFGGGGKPYRYPIAPFAEDFPSRFPMHWHTGLNDDGRGGTYNALEDAREGSAWYANLGFRTSLETPAGVGHSLTGQFGRVVAEQLDRHDGAPPPGPFVDVAGDHPFAAEIDWLVTRRITSGYADGTFKPNQPVSRGEFAAFLYRYAGASAACDPNRFTDVRVAYCDAVTWAAHQSITTGYADGRFGVPDPISRAEAVAFLYRYAGSSVACDPNRFTDVRVAHCPAITWAANRGVTEGYGDGTFRPGQYVNRGQIGAFLHRFGATA